MPADIENKPVEDIKEEVNLEEFDDAGFDEEFEDVDETVVDIPVETEEETSEEQEQPEETQEELDYTPFLETLSKKVKYKDEDIKIENLDDVITNYQKGKNYDTLQEKLNNLENSEELQYINRLAKENGMTPKEYIQAVQKHNEEQEKIQEQEKLQDMVEKGVPEEVAREVIETAKLRKQLNEEKLQLQKEKETKSEQEKKNAEYTDFLTKYPNVKAEDIPKEVFEEAKKSNLKSAYTEYLLDLKEKELQQLKNQDKVNKTSPVKGVTQHGTVQKEKVDPFEQGFDDEFDD